nr:sigma-70 family RNA polymerase sigma factor [Halomonas socia]
MPSTEHAAKQLHSLYSDHHGWLYGWLRRKLGNACDAADLAHDTFLRLFVRRLPGDLGDEPRALLTHIAKGLVIDHWRRQDVERAWLDTLASVAPSEVPSAEAQVLILDVLYRIEAVLRDLPPRTCEIFLLSQLEGLTYQRIAERMDVSLITVKRHMRTAFAACLALR